MREQLSEGGPACITNTRHSTGLGRGHALGRGSQDSTVDPWGSLKAVPHFGDASRVLSRERCEAQAAQNIADVIGRLLRDTGESP